MLLASLALAALLQGAPPPADTTWGAIRGTVQSEPSGLPVPLATVEVQAAERRVVITTADSVGAYRLSRIPAGRTTVRVRHLEHAPLEVEVLVPAGGEVQVDVGLRHRPLALDTLQAANGGDRAAAAQPGAAPNLAVTNFPAIEGSGVGGALGGSGAGQIPGGGGGEGGDVLLVRGAAADLKLVLLDGAPVYAPFHLGGLIDSFEPGLLSSARLYLGGAPARYDGGISYVLDLATRQGSPGRHTLTGALDMVGARGVVEGPVWRGATYLLAGRTVHGASLARLEGEPFPYVFGDGLARVEVPLAAGTSVSVMGFANAEGVRIDTIPWRENFARWSNRAGSVRLKAPFMGSAAELTAAVSGFDTWIPQGDANKILLEARTRRTRLSADLGRTLGTTRLSYGFSYDEQQVRHRAVSRAAGERRLFDVDHRAVVSGWYVDGSVQASRRVVLRGGLRGDYFSRGGPWITFSPRLSGTWLLSDRAALTLAGGRYHQFVRIPYQQPFYVGETNYLDSLNIATEFSVAQADHVSLSLDQQLVEGVRLGLEGYYKHYRGIPYPQELGTYTSGVDVWVRRTEGALSGWLGYSLNWSWSLEDEKDDSVRTDRFQGRQILSAGLTGEIGRSARVELRVAYGAGLPYTALRGAADGVGAPSTGTVELEDEAPLASLTPQDFLRLDAQLSRTWRPRVADRRTELTPYFRLLNGLDRRDALFYRYDRSRGDGQASAVAALPVLPVLGVQWKF